MRLSNSNNPNQLVVEGFGDLYSVVGLMRAHVTWPQDRASAPVHIHMGNGAEEILRDGFLTTFLKSSVIKSFGVMLDADIKPRGRYNRIRDLASPFFRTMPSDLPKDGLVVENEVEKKRFGVWIMPDNASEGGLETIGCGCRDHHVQKANLFTWLAWQDPPGQSPGESLTRKVLDPHSPSANTFVSWFRKLYAL